jgi:hypothetical protein
MREKDDKGTNLEAEAKAAVVGPVTAAAALAMSIAKKCLQIR